MRSLRQAAPMVGFGGGCAMVGTGLSCVHMRLVWSHHACELCWGFSDLTRCLVFFFVRHSQGGVKGRGMLEGDNHSALGDKQRQRGDRELF